MIPRKKYEKNKITQFTKNRMIIRKGGYFPRRLYLTAIGFGMLITLFTTLLIAHTYIWFLFLFPMIVAGLIMRYFYKNHIRFGEKISINKSRIAIELYGSNTRILQFYRDTIKSTTCTLSGLYYHFKVYKNDNSSISFSVFDAMKQDPLKAIFKFTDLKKILETTSADAKIIRYWSKSSNHKRGHREIKDISEALYEYRSDYFSITTKDNDLSIQMIGVESENIFIDKTKRIINYHSLTSNQASITFDNIVSIEKIITETSPITVSNQINIRLVAHLNDGESIDILNYKTHESILAEMDIIEIAI